MKKIGLVGLYSIDNMGDCLICETTRFIVEKNTKDVEVVDVDAVPRRVSSYPGIHKLNLFGAAFLIRFVLPLFASTVPRSKARYYFERFAWRLRLRWYFKKIIPDCDAIIFSGGGFLKYRNQGLNYLVEQIVEQCEINGISVMFSGVGIEGFDIYDHRCRRLKETLASSTIRAITTRDYLEILRDKYQITDPTHTSLVGDPAFWAPQCYGIQKNVATKTIGINLIREDIFQHYGHQLSARELKSFYVGLIDALDEQGAEWVLFSNGMAVDHEFGLALLQEMGKSKEKLLPPPNSAREMIALISNFRCILGARMHACISAYSLDIPVVGLIWNEKLTRLAEVTGQRHMFFDENELDVRLICNLLLDTIDTQYDDELRQDLKERTQEQIKNFLRSV